MRRGLAPSLVELAARRSRRTRDAAARLDLLLSTGPRYAWRLVREARLLDGAGGDANDRIYAGIWEDAAAAVGARIEHLPHDVIELHLGAASTRVWRQWVMLDDVVTVRVALDRTLSHRLVAGAGLPVPTTRRAPVADISSVARLLDEPGAVCVVKPASGTGGGRGTTAGVRTPAQMARAALLASRHDDEVLVERQARGDVYRFLFLDGELLDVVRRLPPTVTGDGHSSVRDLIGLENRRRITARGDAGLSLITANLDAVFTLAAAGLDLGSVPDAGTRVQVKTVTNQSGPADNHTVREPVAPELVAEARSAAAAVGVRLAGVDVITPDLTAPLRAAGGVIIEVNGGPGLHHHYHVADRAGATRVAVPVLRRLLDLASATPSSVS
jgi:D-alanine-D-alanine ligase-like ATP-grasp enzyme